MSSPRQRLVEETDSFEAFEAVTEALEHIDSFDPSGKNDAALLAAERSLADALSKDNDPGYLKASYLLAMVNYLKGGPEGVGTAISQYGGLLDNVDPNTPFGKELRYNMAAAYSADRQWARAEEEFGAVIGDTEANPDLRLTARAGLALTCARHMAVIISRLRSPDRAIAESRNDAKLVTELLETLNTQYKSVELELGRHDAAGVFDREVVKEVVRIIGDAYVGVDNDRVTEIKKLLPAEAPAKKPKLSARVKRIILRTMIAVILFAIFVQLLPGWDRFFRFVSSLIGR